MLRDALYIARMDARYLLSRRETIIWTFVMPVAFFYFIGTINGRNNSATTLDPIAVSAPADAGFLADELARRLTADDFRVVRTHSPEEFAKYGRRLEIPAGFTDSVLAGHPMKVKFTRSGGDLDTSFDQLRLSRAVYTLLADLSTTRASGAVPTPETFAALAAQPRKLTLAVHSAGKRVEAPSGYEQSVPGIMVMFTMLVLFTSGAVTLTIERRSGILRRLATSPMPRGAVVLGKWGARMAVGGIQIAFAMLTGSILFHVNWGPNLTVVLFTMLAYGALAAALAMLLGNFGGAEGQVIGLGVILTNVMAGLGGCWWPIEVTPPWAQKLALFLPTGLTMNALHKLVNFGAPPSAVVPHLAVLSFTAAIALYALSRRFRFE
ncbi:MAG TPA: ABC transporter permease [Bryobacteraceae bacterium]|jgi:ABC-type multidrug transport system permease subunit|nr:ABC transporter permease [Bryobacteraceae bacterium]